MEQSARPCQQTCRRAVVRQAVERGLDSFPAERPSLKSSGGRDALGCRLVG